MNTKGKVLEEYPEIIAFQFLKMNMVLMFLFIAFSILSLGLFAIILYWNKTLRHMVYSETADITEADKVAFTMNDGEVVYCEINIRYCKLFKGDAARNLFTIRMDVRIYYFDEQKKRFFNIGAEFQKRVGSWLERDPSYIEKYVPQTSKDSEELLDFFGNNVIRLEQRNPILHSIELILMPLNIYQIVLAALFIYFGNYVWGIHLIVYIIMGVGLKVMDRRAYINSINQFSLTQSKVNVLRLTASNRIVEEEIDEGNLVIGDIMRIQNSQKINCDAVILYGDCLVNQSVLTGESVPVSKESIRRPNGLATKLDESNVLYSGSECIVVKTADVWGLVIGTGWSTFKGSLLGQIAKEKVKTFKFDSDFLLSSLILGIAYVAVGIMLSIRDYYLDRFHWGIAIMQVVRIIGFALQPGLLMAMIISAHYLQYRLSKKNIAVKNVDKLKEAGRVGVVCFDKTGTLTEDQVEVCGFLLQDKEKAEFGEFVESLQTQQEFKHRREVIECTGFCNNLHFIKGNLIADPIDLEMFSKSGFKINSHFADQIITGPSNKRQADKKRADAPRADQLILNPKTFASFIEDNQDITATFIKEDRRQVYKLLLTYDQPDGQGNESGSADNFKVHHIFDFTPERKRLSVITSRDLRPIQLQKSSKVEREYFLYAKGAPETIKKLCKPDSYPANFDRKVVEYSSMGYRLIAIAFRSLAEGEVGHEADQLENNLEFLGFVILHNQQKPKTSEIIEQLKSNSIKCVIVTGDSIFTGVNVAIGAGVISRSSNIYIGEAAEEQKIRWTELSEDEMSKLKHSQNISQLSNGQRSLGNHSIAPRDIVSSFVPHHIDISLRKIVSTIEKEDTVLAVEGDAFDILLKQYQNEPEVLHKIVQKIAIFGRSRPDQKERVVNILKTINEPKEIKIGFVGDGSNDSKALNSAHMGLSISNIETSIAGSFSSPEKDISPVIDLLIEGRYSLENLIQIVKISIYVGWMKSLALVLIYWLGQWETSYDFLVNVMYMLPIFISVSLSRNSEHLNPFMPKPGLLDAQSLKQFLTAIFLGTIYLLICFQAAIYRPEFKNTSEVLFNTVKTDIDEDFFVENKFLTFCFVTNYFFVTLALHRGYPFKQPFYKNYLLVCYMTVSFIIVLTPLFVQYTFYCLERFANAYMRNVEFDIDLRMKAIFYPLLFSIVIVSSIKIIDSTGMARKIRRLAQKRGVVVKV